jgi:hypothetical protein
MSTPAVTSLISAYEKTLTDHWAGTVDTSVIAALERLAPKPLRWSMETGCGKTTILLSNLSEHHHVFAEDDLGEKYSSIRYYRDCPATQNDRVALVAGSTRRTLPQFAFETPIDLALLDGPHAYPFPELEYYFVYPHIRPGGLLVIDDIHIPTIHRMHRFLAEDDMWNLVHIERTTAFFTRTDAPTFWPLGDGWEFQKYNKARFPVTPAAQSDQRLPAPLPPPPPLPPLPRGYAPEPRVAALEQRLAEAEAQVRWWQHVADERRIKRRLARRLGPLGRLIE